MKHAATSAALGLLLVPAPALACGTYTMEMRWQNSDVIVDGTLICPGLHNPCTVRAARVLKPLSAGGIERRNFPVEMLFDFQEADMTDCWRPWLPTAERTRGRYFLVRDERSRYFMNGGSYFPYGGLAPAAAAGQEDSQ